MTYSVFLVVFLLPPVVVLALPVAGRADRRLWILLAALSLIALAYTAPWDNLIVVNGVWTYHAHQILGPVLGRVPLEEYIFYVLQVTATGLWTVWLARRIRGG